MNKLLERFSALKMRERRLILLAASVGLALVGFVLFIDPARQDAVGLRANLARQETEWQTLETQNKALRAALVDPDAGNRNALADANLQVTRLDQELHAFDHLLVSPGGMPAMLQKLLARHRGLQLVGLRTLGAAPLATNKPAVTAAAPATVAPGAPAQPAQPALASPAAAPLGPPPGGIYRHGLEIRVAGSYADLLAYVEELQRISPRPLWSGMSLKVVEYPRSELTLTLYTLSLDLPWLAV